MSIFVNIHQSPTFLNVIFLSSFFISQASIHLFDYVCLYPSPLPDIYTSCLYIYLCMSLQISFLSSIICVYYLSFSSINYVWLSYIFHIALSFITCIIFLIFVLICLCLFTYHVSICLYIISLYLSNISVHQSVYMCLYLYYHFSFDYHLSHGHPLM